ncbi:UDP-glucose 4-epimerase GalE [Candidatus Saccharibacteria bacterium]|nr:UDP-glucose 4-epimerase GalE [Candidatus Saccharibacteria bacterium]MBR3323892.1 UDP-glucose 4-epimerase GalE [Candidatus Saccharibacteria bacterium]
MSEKILVTGGTGYIGSHTVVELIQQGYEVEILDNLFNSKITVLDKIEKLTGVKPKFYKVDMLDMPAMEKVFAENTYDAVIHFAGLKAVGESVEQPLRYYENNVTGTINLLKCMKEHGTKKIIFSSSATVYGDQGVEELNEEMTTGVGVTNPYGWTKAMIEQIMKDVALADPEFEVVLLRYFNPVGAHPSGLLGEDPNDKPNNLMPIVMKVATGEIPELSVFGDDYDTPDGTCIRDYIHVIDLAKGHIAAIRGLKPGVEIYNLGSGKGTSVLEMIAAFDKASGKKLPYKIVGRRAGDLAAMWANPGKAERELGWKTELTIDDAMRDTLNYLDSHSDV